MLFNSFQFILFFLIITTSYFLVDHKYRNALLLIASCYFYMSFVPGYILVLGLIIAINFFAGLYIEKVQVNNKKLFLIISLAANIGILAFFKYFNFLNSIITHVFQLTTYQNNIPYLNIILPIGLSFHTFQAISYTVEVYRRNQKAERHFEIFALYVMFFPQLIAGPIERPQNLLHQFYEKHKYDFERIKEGIIRMAWGLLKKIVIADRLGQVVDFSYSNLHVQNGVTLMVACIFYSFQIYCDFSGYSDIALGSAKVLGFDLMENFNNPYLSKSVAEFWNRWHISLSSWFFDYVYNPLVFYFRKLNLIGVTIGLMITFFLSGLWHGAGWTFIIFGLIHGTALVYELWTRRIRKKILRQVPDVVRINMSRIIVFIFATFAWIFFRSPNLKIAALVISKLKKISFNDPLIIPFNNNEMAFCIILIVVMMLKEKFYRVIPTSNTIKFCITTLVMIIFIFFFGVFSDKQFIYYQF